MSVGSSYLIIWGSSKEEEAAFPEATFSMGCVASIKQSYGEEVKLNSKSFSAIKKNHNTAALFCNSVSPISKSLPKMS